MATFQAISSSKETKLSSTENSKPNQSSGAPASQPRRRPNLHQLHADRLPVQTYPLPTLTLHNPVSALRCLYLIISQSLFSSPLKSSASSLPIYQGHFSPVTRTIHIVDEKTMRALWERGFFGKGSLSRSEPAWLEKEKRRLVGVAGKQRPGMTSEEVTRMRREERQKFKLERARAQAEAVREQLRRERAEAEARGTVVDGDSEGANKANDAASEETTTNAATAPTAVDGARVNEEKNDASESKSVNDTHFSSEQPPTQIDSKTDPASTEIPTDQGEERRPTSAAAAPLSKEKDASTQQQEQQQLPVVSRDRNAPSEITNSQIVNKEHLDLTLEEAFFLSYGLGALGIRCSPGIMAELGGASDDKAGKRSDDSVSVDENDNTHLLYAPNDTFALFTLFRSVSYSTPRNPLTTPLRPDDPFLVRYATYHHFRSLGWVVREGVKFAVDYLLYYKGPAFSHAQFAVVIVPHYSDEYWSREEEVEEEVEVADADEEGDGAGEEDAAVVTEKSGQPQSQRRRRRRRRQLPRREYEQKDWWWLHCVNRVQAHVYKTLVLAYVDVPSPRTIEACGRDVGKILRSYSIREFCVRRWVPNRNRD